jgi:hypothetical protein
MLNAALLLVLMASNPAAPQPRQAAPQLEAKAADEDSRMSIEDWKNAAATLQSGVTAFALIAGGIWAYWRYIRNEERYPNIEFSADLNFIGRQSEWWIVEVIAIIDNKGKVQHRMSEFKFDLNALQYGDPVETSSQWGNQVDFVRPIAEGSFLPERFRFFFIDPGVKAKYSYIARVPSQVSFLILHCWFNYSDPRKLSHTAEKAVRVPREEGTAGTSAGTDEEVKESPVANQ